MILAIGGAPEFNDSEQATKEIEVVLKTLKKKIKDIKIVYGFGDTKTAGEGGHFYAQQWAESHGVLYRNGNPKWREGGVRNYNAVEERNTILSENADAMILFVKGSNTGGNSIITAFENKGIPIFRVEQYVAKKSLEDSIKVYSKIAEGLVKNSVTLDVETTGLSEITDDIVEIAVVDSNDETTIYNSFIFTKTPIQEKAFIVNNITPDMLEGQPKLAEAWKEIIGKIDGKVIVASNAQFDEKMVCFGLLKQGEEPPTNLWTCLQELYSKYSGQSRRGLNTARIAQQLGIEPGIHRALSDAQAQAQILKAMAKATIPDLTI